MCGDLEEENQPEEFYNRFVAHAHSILATMHAGAGKRDDVLNKHLDQMFRELLLTAVDANKVKDVAGFDRLLMEPLVLARLAGFMAAHVPLSEDPLRRVIEALMLGYNEGEIVLPDHDHHHDHDHDHDHGHSHGYGHTH